MLAWIGAGIELGMAPTPAESMGASFISRRTDRRTPRPTARFRPGSSSVIGATTPMLQPGAPICGDPADNRRDCMLKGRVARPRGELHNNLKLSWEKVREIRSSSEPAPVFAAKLG